MDDGESDQLRARLREVEELASVCSYKPDRDRFAAEIAQLRAQLEQAQNGSA